MIRQKSFSFLLASCVVIASLSAVSNSAFSADLSSIIQAGNNLLQNVAIIGGVTVNAGDPIAATTVLIVGKEGQSEFICSGSVLTQDIVLTAAHCLGDSGNATLVVAFRTNISDQSGPVISVVQQSRPSDFDMLSQSADTDWDDLGILKLAQPIPAGYTPANIMQSNSLSDGETVVLAGYGIDVPVAPADPNDDGGAGVLRKVDQKILQAQYGQTEVLVSLQKKGACHGDSGGPAFIQQDGQLQLFGVTSRLTNDDPQVTVGGQPALSCSVDMVYTNILDRMDWINSTISQMGG